MTGASEGIAHNSTNSAENRAGQIQVPRLACALFGRETPVHHGVQDIRENRADTAAPDTSATIVHVHNGVCTKFAEERVGPAVPATSA